MTHLIFAFGKTKTSHHWYRLTELISLFFLLPIILWFWADTFRGWANGGSFVILVLPIFAIGAVVYLRRFSGFSWQHFFSFAVTRTEFFSLLQNFFWLATISAVATWLFFPELLFYMPTQHKSVWLTLLVAYPIFSVIPQTIIYRVFFESRYADVFSSSTQLIVTSAVCFGFGHIIFDNWFAPSVCFIGGLLLAWRYHNSRSLLLTSFEHALYGNWLFTVGLGKYLLSGEL